MRECRKNNFELFYSNQKSNGNPERTLGMKIEEYFSSIIYLFNSVLDHRKSFFEPISDNSMISIKQYLKPTII